MPGNTCQKCSGQDPGKEFYAAARHTNYASSIVGTSSQGSSRTASSFSPSSSTTTFSQTSHASNTARSGYSTWSQSPASSMDQTALPWTANSNRGPAPMQAQWQSNTPHSQGYSQDGYSSGFSQDLSASQTSPSYNSPGYGTPADMLPPAGWTDHHGSHTSHGYQTHAMSARSHAVEATAVGTMQGGAYQARVYPQSRPGGAFNPNADQLPSQQWSSSGLVTAQQYPSFVHRGGYQAETTTGTEFVWNSNTSGVSQAQGHLPDNWSAPTNTSFTNPQPDWTDENDGTGIPDVYSFASTE